MRLATTVPPRTNGIVTVTMPGKFGAPDKVLTFKPDDDGDLVGDVPEDMVPSLLASGNFAPADEADFDRAAELMAAAGVAGSGDDASGDDDDGNGLPQEANTPPRRRPPGARRKAAAV